MRRKTDTKERIAADGKVRTLKTLSWVGNLMPHPKRRNRLGILKGYLDLKEMK
jgi:hypothetical protein